MTYLVSNVNISRASLIFHVLDGHYLKIQHLKVVIPLHIFNLPDVVIVQRNQNVNAFLAEMKSIPILRSQVLFEYKGFQMKPLTT